MGTNLWSWLCLFASAPLLVVAAAVARLAWRGRRVGDHPHCANCGFDLVGTPPEADRCGECGSDLRKPGSRITGVRQVHRRGLVFAAVLGLFACGAVVAVVPGTLGRIDWQPQKPAWMLRWDLASADRNRAISAASELKRRARKGALSDPQITAIAEAAIRRQASAAAGWDPSFGDLVQMARARGLVADAAWKQYARHAPRLTVEARSVVRRGDPLPYAVIMQPARVGDEFASAAGLYLSQRVTGVRANGGAPQPVEDLFVRFHGPTPIGRHPRWLGENRALRLPDLESGDHRLTFVLDLSVVVPEPAGRNASVLVAWREEVDVNVTVVAPDVETVTLVNDPALENGVRRAITLTGTRPHPDVAPREAIVAQGGGAIADFAIRMSNLPVGVAFDAFLRDANGVERRVGRVTARAGLGRAAGVSFHESELWGLTGDRLSIVLRASPDAARRTVDLTSIWGGELVLPDVPVVWLKPPAKP